MDFESIVQLFSCLSLVIGAVECFAGFKIMKALAVVWGFFFGAMLGVVLGVAAKSVILGIILVIVLGAGFGAGLAILIHKLYLAGTCILTSFLLTAAFYVISKNLFAALFLGLHIGALTIFFVKPTVIISTAFSGAGIILSSAYLMMNMGVNGNAVVTVILWIPITIAGVAVQYITTQTKRVYGTGTQAVSSVPATSDKRKHSGMQRAYRNFCICCGSAMQENNAKCPHCGFSFEE